MLTPRFGRMGLYFWCGLFLAVLLCGILVIQWRQPDIANQNATELERRLAEASQQARQQEEAKRQFTMATDQGGNQKVINLATPPEALSEPFYQIALAEQPQIQAKKQKLSRNDRRPTETFSFASDALTQNQHFEHWYEYRMQDLQACQKLTLETGAARELGERFALAYLQSQNHREGALTSVELTQLADQVESAEVTDPVVKYFLIRHRLDNLSYQDSTFDQLQAIVQELRERNYPPLMEVLCRMSLEEVASKLGRISHERKDLYALAILRWLEAESLRPEWTDCVVTQLHLVYRSPRRADRTAVLRASLQSPDVAPYFVHLLLGNYWYDSAWDIRGNELAYKVNEDNWRIFEERMERAKVHTEYAWHLQPEIPHSAVQLIEINTAYSQHGDAPHHWFLRAIESRCDYTPAYWAYWNSLYPRWGGSHKEQIQFMENCVKTNRFDLVVPYLPFELLTNWQEREFQNSEDDLARQPIQPLLIDFQTRRTQFRADHPGAVLHGDWDPQRTAIGLMFERFGMDAAAVAEFQLNEGRMDRSRLQKWNRLGVHLWKRLHAATGPVRQQVLKFDEQLRSRWPADTNPVRFEELRQELAKLQPTANDQFAREYYSHAEHMINDLETYVRGDWVEVRFNRGWEICADEYGFDDDGRTVMLDLRYGDSPQVWARPLIHFEPPFEVEVFIDNQNAGSSLTPCGPQWTRPDFNFQWRTLSGEPYIGTVVRMPQDPPVSLHGDNVKHTLAKAAYYRDLSVPREEYGPRKLTLRLWPMAYEVFTPGYSHVVSLTEPIVQNGVLSIGEAIPREIPRERGHNLSLQFRNARIRKLTMDAPPILTASLEAQIQYWIRRAEQDTTDVIARARLVEIYSQLGRYQEVIRTIDEIQAQEPHYIRLRTNQARALLRLGKCREAQEIVPKGIDGDYLLDSEIVQLQIWTGAVDSEFRDGEQAMRTLLPLLAGRHQGNPEVIACHAAACAEIGDFDKAEDLINQALNATQDERLKREFQIQEQAHRSRKPFFYQPETTDPE